MKEIYRSFEGKLNAQNQDGYTVKQDDTACEIWFYSVQLDRTDRKYRCKLSDAPADWSDVAAVGELCDAIINGRIDGQVFFKSKWRNPQQIMDTHKDFNWQKYCY